MAKKKSGEKKDKHKSGFLVRLPETFRPPLALVKKQTHRPTTVEVQLALVKHLKDVGVTPPEVE